MLYLIVDPERSFAEELADALATRDPLNTVLPEILEIRGNETASEIVRLAVEHVKKFGRPAVVFLSIELPDTDANKMLDFIASIGESASVIPMGCNLTEIIAASSARRGMPLYVPALLGKPLTPLGVSNVIAKIKAQKRKLRRLRQNPAL